MRLTVREYIAERILDGLLLYGDGQGGIDYPMAQAPLRKCNTAGCRTLTRQSHCPRHAKEKRTPDTLRPNSYQRGYDKQWSKVRALKLSTDPLCEDCLKENRTTAASEVHHIEKISVQPGLRLDMDNLMSLCTMHHSRRTRRGE